MKFTFQSVFRNSRQNPRHARARGREESLELYSILWSDWPTSKQKVLRHGNRFAARVRRRYFSKGEKRRPEIRLGIASYFPIGFISFLAVSPCYVRFCDLRIFSLPFAIYMGKQVGSRFGQMTRTIRTDKFYSGIVFTIRTKKRLREPETGIKDGMRISIWNILFRPAKIGLPNISFPFSIYFSTGFSAKFVEMVKNRFTSLYITDEVWAIRTSNIRLFRNCFALFYDRNPEKTIEIENRFEKLNHPLSLGTITFLLIVEL